MEGLAELKSVLRSLVVSSPTQMDVRMLLHDYRVMRGEQLPYFKYGYHDAVKFLRERCNDCFQFKGMEVNPTLILIVSKELRHIDEHVRKQKTTSSKRSCGKSKRVSVSEAVLKPKESLIAQSFKDRIAKHTVGNQHAAPPQTRHAPPAPPPPAPHAHPSSDLQQRDKENRANLQEDGNHSRINWQNFLRKRFPLSNSSQYLDGAAHAAIDTDSCKDGGSKNTSDSGRQTASSGSSARRGLLEELKAEVTQLVEEHPHGVLCTDVVQLYRERFGRELELARCGLTSVTALLEAAAGAAGRLWLARDADGEWRVRPARAATPSPPPPARRAARALASQPSAARSRSPVVDVDDALPGVDFDPDVFPADCVHFMESVPALGAAAFAPHEQAGVVVGEVYSPSHFWLIRLGDKFNLAMEELMDEMNSYYTNGPGKDRVLALGAVRPGHYCASVYEGDWHRSIIVRVLDCDTVKVRHVDYGTVERVSVERLRPLLRCWAALPAQAVRARLAGVQPGAGGRRWPPAAAAAFLQLVRDKHLVARVLATDPEEDVVEVLLADTTTDTDVWVGEELVRAGHADPRAASALRTSECFLFPRFEALESGETPNFAEIHAYLRDGIALEYVEEYRRHVPSVLPPLGAPPPPPPRRAEAASSPPSEAPSLPMLTRVPLLCGLSASHSDKATQLSPPASPASPVHCVSLIDLSPPPSPSSGPAQPSLLTSTTPLLQSFAATNISSAPPLTVSSAATVSSSTATVFSFAPTAVSAAAPTSFTSAPTYSFAAPTSSPAAPTYSFAAPTSSPAAPTYSFAAPTSSPAALTLSPAAPTPSPAAPTLSPPVPTLSPAAAVFSPGASMYCPTPNHPFARAPPAHTYAGPPMYHQPPGFLPAHAPYPLTYPQVMPPQFRVYPGPFPYRPAPPAPPAPPALRRFRTPDGGAVSLSVSQCEIYRLLSQVDQHAAHCYMVEALERAMGTRLVSAAPAPRLCPAPLNPDARPFPPPHPAPAERMRPPPGFEERR